MAFVISARGRSCFPWSVNFLGFFVAACSKVLRKASLNLMKEQVSRLAESAVVQYVTYRISSHFGYTVETLISGLRRKGIILQALMWAVTSLWPQKVAFRSQNNSARAKLMLIFWPGQRLCKKLFWRPASKFTCDDLCGESESYWERVMWWYLARIKCGNIGVWLVVDSYISAANVVNCVISWSCWQTDGRYVVAFAL